MTLDEIRARLADIEAERRKIDAAAGDAALNDEQQARWNELDTEETQLRADLDEAERRERVAESRAKWRTTQVGTKVTPFDDLDVARMTYREASDRARAHLERDELHLNDEQRARLERLLQTRNDNLDGGELARRLLVTEHPDYREAFLRLVTRNSPTLSPEQVAAVHRYEEFRAMAIGTPSAGGYGVPVELAA